MVKKIPPFKWKKIQPSLNVRTRQHNIVTRVPMLKNHAKAIGDKQKVEDVWKLFFTDNIMQKIVLETNKKITQMKENYKDKNLPFLQSMDKIELKALIGLLAFISFQSRKRVSSQFLRNRWIWKRCFQMYHNKREIPFPAKCTQI